MTDHRQMSTSRKKKEIIIASLFTFTAAIILAGASFSVYSLMYKINFPVLGSEIPGAVFGLVIVFLGVRYFLSVKKLKVDVLKAGTSFSWSNFKKTAKR